MSPLPKERWQQVEALFDEARTLPPEQRAGLLALRVGNNAELLREVEALLEAAETRGDLLDRPAAAALLGIDPFLDGLPPGSRVGPWRIEALVGRGGMGEVYRAQRDDGAFQQTVALKLIRREAVDQLDRFHEERRVLARLEHPGIARLIDGGVAEDGRPYMAMEWVDGVPITDWCRTHTADQARRLELFVQVCESVAYAHRNLLVHRDLKPGNVLVTPEGRTKLLDFGVAKLLTTTDVEQTRTQAPMTLAYAAPEQLEQGAITPAVDVYALGLLLFELLTVARPWQNPQLSLSMLMERRQRDAPAPSATASRLRDAPIPAKHLEGDLDAITAFSLRREPERRYRSAAELADDVKRHLDGKPVQARPESLGYSLNRFVRRNRVATGFAVVAILALVAGLGASLWQASEARREAARATATKDFLVGVFRASDPRIAQDKPRGQITAKELLDLNAPKINEEFGNDPDTQIELLGTVASIYGLLSDYEGYRSYREQQMAAARRHGGDLHPVYIRGLLEEADWNINVARDNAAAMKFLEQADPLIQRAGLDRTKTRAFWWVLSAEVEPMGNAGADSRVPALERAIELFQALKSETPEHVSALLVLGQTYMSLDPPRADLAIPILESALALSSRVRDQQVTDVVLIHSKLAHAREVTGDTDGALREYEAGLRLARRTFGEGDAQYWRIAANYGDSLFVLGRRSHAHALFDDLLRAIPADRTVNSDDDYAREVYASGLLLEGRAAAAIPILQSAYDAYRAQPSPAERDLDRVRWRLALAYDDVGRSAEAEVLLEEFVERAVAAQTTQTPKGLRRRERWGRFLLDHGRDAESEVQFRAVLSDGGDQASAPVALAKGGMARLALKRGDTGAALEASREGSELFARAKGLLDVRGAPYLWLIHSEAQRASRNPTSARDWAQRAMEASQSYDDPAAPSIAEAQIALSHAHLDLGDVPNAQRLAEQATAIHVAHKDLAAHYRQNLQELQGRLKQR